MSPLTWVAFVAVGAAGACARFLVDIGIARRTRHPLPWATLVINTSGSFVLGVITGLVIDHGLAAPYRLVLGTGFCGAYTTFSTFTLDAIGLADGGRTREAAAYVAATTLLCAAGAALGLAVAAL